MIAKVLICCTMCPKKILSSCDFGKVYTNFNFSNNLQFLTILIKFCNNYDITSHSMSVSHPRHLKN